MKILSLSLHNFRGFESLDLDFDPNVTALVGVNGAGKSSILDAIACSQAIFVNAIFSGRLDPRFLQDNDVRLGAPSSEVLVSADLGGKVITWRIAKATLPHEPRNELEALRAYTDELRSSLRQPLVELPLIVYFGTSRSVIDIPRKDISPRGFPPLSALEYAFDAGSRSFQGFFEWFRQEEDIYNEQLVSGSEADAPSHLPTVRAAIEGVLTGARGLRVERRQQRMTVEINGVRLDVAQLSDGEKCLLAMTGDLARRMALAAPNSKEPLHQQAVVLIDEIELHLHPGLQREIIPRLRRVFPNVQLIVSTHSPQVLSSLRATNIRVIEGFALRPLDRETWRRDTNRILETAFHDPGRPPEVAQMLNALRAAVDDDRFEEARRIISNLNEMVGGIDPDVFYYQQMIPPRNLDM